MDSISLPRRHDSFEETVTPLDIVRRHASLLISLCVFYVIIGILLSFALNLTQGYISYSLDDTFIHMAIAKHFAVNGVWGVTPYEFSSSSSSPLYTLMLSAAYYCFGTNMLAPLIINIILSTILLTFIDDLLHKQHLGFGEKICIMLLITLFMPLPILTVMGMEHVLHTAITLGFVYISAELISKPSELKSRYATLLFAGALLTSSRYEGLFVVVPVCFLFLCRKKFLFAVVLGIASLLPIIVYGIISVKQGSYWLPNSVLLKGQEVSLFSFKGIENLYKRPLSVLSEAPWLFAVGVFVFTMGVIRHIMLKLSIWNAGQLMIFIFFIAMFFHLEFAKVGWVYRYEAYLMGLGILLLGMFSKETFAIIFERFTRQQRIAAVMVISIMSLPVIARGMIAIVRSPLASKNIYEQQCQMGRFLKTYYNKQTVMAADIGAINFFADLNCVDVMGLGSIEVAKAKRDGHYNQSFLRNMADTKDVRIAVVYDHEFFQNQQGWIKVAQWKIQDNKVAACDKVTFYAVKECESENLMANLKAFESRLPSTVRVSYF